MNEMLAVGDTLQTFAGEADTAPAAPVKRSRTSYRVADGDGLDAMTLFLNDVGDHILLTAQQEWALARRIRGEDVPVPGPGLPRRPSPTEARDCLERVNLRLVISVARRYAGRGVPMPDLVQEGWKGLRRAGEKFDPDRGWRFSTFATWWVRQCIGRAVLDTARTIRVPVHMAVAVGRVQAAVEAWHDADVTGRPPVDHLAEVTGLTENVVREALRALTLQPRSIDEPINAAADELDGTSLGETIADRGPSAEDELEASMLAADVRAILARLLTSRERTVVGLRFGLGHKRPHSLEEAGRALGVTRERARQIEAGALTKLRASTGARRMLQVYVGRD